MKSLTFDYDIHHTMYKQYKKSYHAFTQHDTTFRQNF